VLTRFEQDIFPVIGRRPVTALDAADFLEPLQRMVKRGAVETARKVGAKCGEVMSFAVVTRRATRNPIPDLKGVLPTVKTKHYASLVYPADVGDLLRAIEAYRGKSRVTTAALRLLPMIFVRGVCTSASIQPTACAVIFTECGKRCCACSR